MVVFGVCHRVCVSVPRFEVRSEARVRSFNAVVHRGAVIES